MKQIENENDWMNLHENYKYLEAVKDDVQRYIDEHSNELKEYDSDELKEYLNGVLFIEDSVTGNASGSYWLNAYKAEAALCHNIDLYLEALSELGCDLKEEASRFSPELADVTIRCYLLHQAIEEVIG